MSILFLKVHWEDFSCQFINTYSYIQGFMCDGKLSHRVGDKIAIYLLYTSCLYIRYLLVYLF